MTENISKEHLLFEANRDYPEYYVDRNDVKIGDTIIYIANNQLASKKYIVVERMNENGNVEKGLKEIEFTPSKKMTPSKEFTPLKDSNKERSNIMYHFFSDDGSSGGKKKHKKTQHKRTKKQQSKYKKMKSKKYRRHKK